MAPTSGASAHQYSKGDLAEFLSNDRSIRGGVMSTAYNRWFAYRTSLSFVVAIRPGIMNPDACSLADIDVSPGAPGVPFKQMLTIISTLTASLAAIVKSGDRYTHVHPLMKLKPGSVAPPNIHGPRQQSPTDPTAGGSSSYGQSRQAGGGGDHAAAAGGEGVVRRRQRVDIAAMEESFSAGNHVPLSRAAEIMARPHDSPQYQDGSARYAPRRDTPGSGTSQAAPRVIRVHASSLTEGLEENDISPLVVLIEPTYAPTTYDVDDEALIVPGGDMAWTQTASVASDPMEVEESVQAAASLLNFSLDDDEELRGAIEGIKAKEQRLAEEHEAKRRAALESGASAAAAASRARDAADTAPLRRRTLPEILSDVESMIADSQAIAGTIQSMIAAGIPCVIPKMDVLDRVRKLIQKKKCIEALMREDREIGSDGDGTQDLLSPLLRGKIPYSGCSGEVLTGIRMHILNATTIQFNGLLLDIVENADQEMINSTHEAIVSTVRENLTDNYAEALMKRREAAKAADEEQCSGEAGGGGGSYAADIVTNASSSIRNDSASGKKRARKAPSIKKRSKTSTAASGAENEAGLMTSMTYAVNAMLYLRAKEGSLRPYYENESRVTQDISGGVLDPENVFCILNALSWDDGLCHHLQSLSAYATHGGGNGSTYLWAGGAVCNDGFRYFRFPTCNGHRVAPGDIRNNFLATMNLPSRNTLTAPGFITENADRFPAPCLERLGISPKPRQSGFSDLAAAPPSPTASVASSTSSRTSTYSIECAAKLSRLEAQGVDGSVLYNEEDAMLSAAKHSGTPFDPRSSLVGRFTAPDGRESPALQNCAAAAACSHMAADLASKLPTPVREAEASVRMGLRRWCADEVGSTIMPTEARNSPSERCVAKALTTGCLSSSTPPVFAPYTSTLPAACDAFVRGVHETHEYHCVAMSFEAYAALQNTYTGSMVKGNSVRNNMTFVGPKGGGKSTIIGYLYMVKLPAYISADGKICTTIKSMREWSPTALTAGPNDNDRRTIIVEEFRVDRKTVDHVKNAMSSGMLSRDVTFTDPEGNRHVITYSSMARSIWITTCNNSSLCIESNTGKEDQAALLDRTPRIFISAKPESAIGHMLRQRLQGRMDDVSHTIDASVLREHFADAFMMLFADLVVAEATPPPCEDLAMIILAGVAHTLHRRGHPSIAPRFFGFIIALATVMALNGVYYREWNMPTGRFAGQPMTPDRIVIATENGVAVGVECIVMAIGFYSIVMSHMGHGAICAAILSSHVRRSETPSVTPSADLGESLTRPRGTPVNAEGRLRLDGRLGSSSLRSVENASMRIPAVAATVTSERTSRNSALYAAAQQRAAASSGTAERVRQQQEAEQAARDLPPGHEDEIIDPELVDFIVASCPRRAGAVFPAERMGITRGDLLAAYDTDYLLVTISEETAVRLEKGVIKLGKAVSRGVAGTTAEHAEEDDEGYCDDDSRGSDGGGAPGTSACSAGYHPGTFFGLAGRPRVFDPDRYPPRQAILALLNALASGEVGQVKGVRYTLGSSVENPFSQSDNGKIFTAPAAFSVPSGFNSDKRMAVRLCWLLDSQEGTEAVACAVQETLCCSSLKPQVIPFAPGPCGTMRLLRVGPGYGPGATSEKDFDVSVRKSDGKPATRVSAMSHRPYVMPDVFLRAPPSALAQAEARPSDVDTTNLTAAGIAHELQEDERRVEEGSRRVLDAYASGIPGMDSQDDTDALNSAVDNLVLGDAVGEAFIRKSLSGTSAHSAMRRSSGNYDSDSEDSFSESSLTHSQGSQMSDDEDSMTGTDTTSIALTEHQRRMRKALRSKSKTVSYKSRNGRTRKIAVIKSFDEFTANLCSHKSCASSEPVDEACMTIAERYSARWLKNIFGPERAVFDSLTSLKNEDRVASIKQLGAVGSYVLSATACVSNHDLRGTGLPMVNVAKARAAGLLPKRDTPCEAILRTHGFMPDTVPIWAVATPDGLLSTYLGLHGRPTTEVPWIPVCEVAQAALYSNYPAEILDDELECVKEVRKLHRDERRRDAQLDSMDVDEGGEGGEDYYENDYSQMAASENGENSQGTAGESFMCMNDLFSAPIRGTTKPDESTYTEPLSTWARDGPGALLLHSDDEMDYSDESEDDEGFQPSVTYGTSRRDADDPVTFSDALARMR